MIYVGLDVSLNSFGICAVDETGKAIRVNDEANARSIVQYLEPAMAELTGAAWIEPGCRPSVWLLARLGRHLRSCRRRAIGTYPLNHRRLAGTQIHKRGNLAGILIRKRILVAAALANKIARDIWAMLTKKDNYQIGRWRPQYDDQFEANLR
ncbi:hypothetical protein WN73_11890 [Bradyrhizobium sp. CCBAU 45394]|uniref:hypothetical protein n=1 Tax=Bradyrhizobium sp. CCBAU 45394 TaxID=1325087 RepID=UPI002302D3A2|nr:hypothetical protein [Bradyrhizobium sp. CCBAU 45394]MDA9391357.1 hypothetical protein [Bradyrhizobium sp. CCBAU 45394]